MLAPRLPGILDALYGALLAALGRGPPSELSMDLQRFVGRMALFVGEAEASRTFAECLREARLEAVRTPDEMLAVADGLMRRGGVANLVGRTLRVRALESGARLTVPGPS